MYAGLDGGPDGRTGRLLGLCWPGHHAPGLPVYPQPDFCLRHLCRPLAEGVLPLNESGVLGHLGWDAGESRLAHWLRFPGWVLVNVHFDAWGEQARDESARLILDFLRDEPVAIVIGDLNCTPDAPPIARFQQAGYALAKDGLPPEVDRRTLTRFSGQQLAEIDYILVRGATVARAMIPRPRREPPYPSDHDPVVANIVIE